jgi:hypothetical protein
MLKGLARKDGSKRAGGSSLLFTHRHVKMEPAKEKELSIEWPIYEIITDTGRSVLRNTLLGSLPKACELCFSGSHLIELPHTIF